MNKEKQFQSSTNSNIAYEKPQKKSGIRKRFLAYLEREGWDGDDNGVGKGRNTSDNWISIYPKSPGFEGKTMISGKCHGLLNCGSLLTQRKAFDSLCSFHRCNKTGTEDSAQENIFRHRVMTASQRCLRWSQHSPY